MSKPISDFIYGDGSTNLLLRKPWNPSSGAFPTDTSEGFVYVAEDDGTVNTETFVTGDSILYKDGAWGRFGSSSGGGGLVEYEVTGSSIVSDNPVDFETNTALIVSNGLTGPDANASYITEEITVTGDGQATALGNPFDVDMDLDTFYSVYLELDPFVTASTDAAIVYVIQFNSDDFVINPANDKFVILATMQLSSTGGEIDINGNNYTIPSMASTNTIGFKYRYNSNDTMDIELYINDMTTDVTGGTIVGIPIYGGYATAAEMTDDNASFVVYYNKSGTDTITDYSLRNVVPTQTIAGAPLIFNESTSYTQDDFPPEVQGSLALITGSPVESDIIPEEIIYVEDATDYTRVSKPYSRTLTLTDDTSEVLPIAKEYYREIVKLDTSSLTVPATIGGITYSNGDIVLVDENGGVNKLDGLFDPNAASPTLEKLFVYGTFNQYAPSDAYFDESLLVADLNDYLANVTGGGYPTINLNQSMSLSSTDYANLDWSSVVIRGNYNDQNDASSSPVSINMSGGATFGSNLPMFDKKVRVSFNNYTNSDPLLDFTDSSSRYIGNVFLDGTGDVSHYIIQSTTSVYLYLYGDITLNGSFNSINNNDWYIYANGHNVNIESFTFQGGSSWKLRINDMGVGSRIPLEQMYHDFSSYGIIANFIDDGNSQYGFIEPPYKYYLLDSSRGTFSINTERANVNYRFSEVSSSAGTAQLTLNAFSPDGTVVEFSSARVGTASGFTSVYTGSSSSGFYFHKDGVSTGSSTFNLPKTGNDNYRFVKIGQNWNIFDLNAVPDTGSDETIVTTGTSVSSIVVQNGEKHLVDSYFGASRTNITFGSDNPLDAEISISDIVLDTRTPTLTSPSGNWIINGVDSGSSTYTSNIGDNIRVIRTSVGTFLYVAGTDAYDPTWRRVASTSLTGGSILVDDRVVIATSGNSGITATNWFLSSAADYDDTSFEAVIEQNGSVLPNFTSSSTIYVNGVNQGTTWPVDFDGQYVKGVFINSTWYLSVSTNKSWNRVTGSTLATYTIGKDEKIVANASNSLTPTSFIMPNNSEYEGYSFEMIIDSDGTLPNLTSPSSIFVNGVGVGGYTAEFDGQYIRGVRTNSQWHLFASSAGGLTEDYTTTGDIDIESTSVGTGITITAQNADLTLEAPNQGAVLTGSSASVTGNTVASITSTTGQAIVSGSTNVSLNQQTSAMTGNDSALYVATKGYVDDSISNWRVVSGTVATDTIEVGDRVISQITDTAASSTWILPDTASYDDTSFELLIDQTVNPLYLPEFQAQGGDTIYVNGLSEGTTYQSKFAGQYIRGVKSGTNWNLSTVFDIDGTLTSFVSDGNIDITSAPGSTASFVGGTTMYVAGGTGLTLSSGSGLMNLLSGNGVQITSGTGSFTATGANSTITASTGAVTLNANTNISLDTQTENMTGGDEDLYIATKKYVDDNAGSTDLTIDEHSVNYTVQASDAGKVLRFTNTTAVDLTVPDSLPLGFTFSVVQANTGDVNFVGDGTGGNALLNNTSNHTKTGGQYSLVTFISDVAGEFVFQGHTAL